MLLIWAYFQSKSLACPTLVKMEVAAMTTVMGLTSVHARMDSLETCARNVSIKAFNM